MRIDVIETDADLEAVKSDWDRVYTSDPHARYFLSWAWLHGYLRGRRRWFILALRENAPGSPHFAFFPLRLATVQDPKTGIFTDDILMAGNHAADYTGLISEPEYEARAIRGFALFLKSQNWANLRLDNFSGPAERCDALIRALSGPDIVHRTISKLDENGIDQTVCPVATLPDSWETYLDRHLNGNARQKLRRCLRQVESDANYRITVSTPETIDRDLDILFRLWRARWGSLKGDATDRIIAAARRILMDAFRGGDLFVPLLWHGERPLAALANLLDHRKKSVLFYIAGRDEEWKTPPPGLVLHGYAIRRAIADGFSSYDFLRGNEPYKYAFGAEDRPIRCVVLRTRTGRNLRETLNIRSIRHVYDHGSQLYAAGDRKNAEAAFEQVIAAFPDHIGALFGLAHLLFDKGRLTEAETAYRNILAKATDALPVLIRLGDTQLALKKFDEAAATFGAVIDRAPNSIQAYFKKGVALAASGLTADAARAFRALEQVHSDDPSQAAYRQKAKEALAKLVRPLSPDSHLPAIHPSGFPLKAVPVPHRLTEMGLKRAIPLDGDPEDFGALPGLGAELPSPRIRGLRDIVRRTKH